MWYIDWTMTNLTNDGIMMVDGEVVADGVNVFHHFNGESNYLTLSYTDRNGVLNTNTTNFNSYRFTFDDDVVFNGILPNNEDWYLFWNNN